MSNNYSLYSTSCQWKCVWNSFVRFNSLCWMRITMTFNWFRHRVTLSSAQDFQLFTKVCGSCHWWKECKHTQPAVWHSSCRATSISLHHLQLWRSLTDRLFVVNFYLWMLSTLSSALIEYFSGLSLNLSAKTMERKAKYAGNQKKNKLEMKWMDEKVMQT